ncbi:MAG: HupE/UreJ family protein [Oxalobacteraceae bacterium]
MSRWAGRILGLIALLSLSSAWAHSGDATGFASVSVHGSSVIYRYTPTTGGTDDATLVRLIREKITVTADQQPCIPAEPEGMQVEYACPAAPKELLIRDDLADALGDKHHVIAVVTWNGGSSSQNFSATAREARIALAGAATPQGAGSFFLLGMEHIATGYDHLLFLLALILCGGNLLSLLKIITAFTLAHSLTLGAAALEIITLPSTLVEAVIALSIAYVAFENLFPRFAVSHRWHISFLFGLVHGFGFSSVLKDIGLPKDSLIWSLLNFNLGVEAGQLVAVLIAVPLLMQLRKTTHEERVVRGLSAIVLAVGLALFVERVVLGA